MNPDSTLPQSGDQPPHPSDPLDIGLAAAFGPDPANSAGTVLGDASHPPLIEDIPPAWLPIGRHKLGVGDKIADGGMGVVYRAVDARFGRDVAVKIVREKYRQNPEVVQQFLNEARITAQLQHPGIPPVHDRGELPDGRPFLVLKLIRGRTLADLLAERPNPAHDRPRFIDIFEQVCQAVGYAHNQGFINRDLKPANVMVGSFREVQVIDWGIARPLTSEVCEPPGAEIHQPAPEVDPLLSPDPLVRTRAGAVIGTPSYMGPEQARGQSVDKRADVFALGVILFEILTAERLYGVGSVGVILHRAANGMVSDALARLDGCGADAELIALAKRCLSPQPNDRPADGAAVAQAVAEYRVGVEERLRAAEQEKAAAAAKASEQRKRRRLRLALAVAVGLLVLGGGAFAWWQDRLAHAERFRLDENGKEIATLLARCEEALKNEDAARAGTALEQAEKRMAGGGGDHLRARLDRCRVDVTALRDINRIADLYWTLSAGKLQKEQADAEWPRVFGHLGVVLGETPVTESVRRIDESLIRDRLLAALDHWLQRGCPTGVAGILHGLDPDPYRDAVRGAIQARDDARMRTLAGRPEALEQPPRFASVLGGYPAIPAARRKAIMAAALARRPGDFPLLVQLASLPVSSKQKDANSEREVWLRAALAVRPTNAAVWNDLGTTLARKGDVVEAVRCFREAVRHDESYERVHVHLGKALMEMKPPDLDGSIASYRAAIRINGQIAETHNTLGIVLRSRGDLGAAEVAYREAIRLDPSYFAAHFNLGIVLGEKGDLDGAIAALREATRLDPKDTEAREALDLALKLKAEREGRLAPPPREVGR